MTYIDMTICMHTIRTHQELYDLEEDPWVRF